MDYKGDIMAEAAQGGESMLAHAILDIDFLRARRRQGGMFNHYSRQLTDVYAMMYEQYPMQVQATPCSKTAKSCLASG